MQFHTVSNSYSWKVIQGVGAYQRRRVPCFADCVLGGSVSWGEGGGGRNGHPSTEEFVQLSYDWPGQDGGSFAVGLLGASGEKARNLKRACKDSSEGWGPGICRAMAGFNICGRLPHLGPLVYTGGALVPRAGLDHCLLQPSLRSACSEPLAPAPASAVLSSPSGAGAATGWVYWGYRCGSGERRLNGSDLCPLGSLRPLQLVLHTHSKCCHFESLLADGPEPGSHSHF